MRYAVQRLLQFVLVFIVVTFMVMAATRIGSRDPARDLVGGAVSQAQIEQVKHDYPYLDKPLVVQYGYWLKDIVTGNWGRSYVANQSVVDMFKERAPSTIFIAFWAIVIGLVIAVPLGVYGAYRRDGFFDRTSSIGSFAFISTPPLVIGVLLLFLVVSKFDFFPTVGRSQYVAPWDNPVEHFKNFFIPSLMLGIGLGAIWSRLLRADMIISLQSDSVLMARAKGISPNRVLWVHALRMSVLSLMTSVALQMAALLGGAVIAEQFFGPKGLGDRLVFAIQQNDILVVQAIAAFITVFVVLANFVVDLLYAVVDPRIRVPRGRSVADLAPSPTAATAASTLAPVGVADPVPRRRLPSFSVVFGLVWLLTLLFLAIFADYLPFVRAPDQRVRGAANYRFGPGNDFWFGSDRLGRDIFARSVYGARISLIIAVTSIVIGLIVGSSLGMLCGYFRGWVDRVVSIITDALLAFPAIILAALVVGRAKVLRTSNIEVLGVGFSWLSNTWAITFVFAMLSIAPISRIVRAQTLSLSQREYVLAARSLGAKTPRVLFREILPNVVPALVSVLFTGVAILLAAEAGLAFLGYSVEAPQASWGLMVAENRERIDTAWWATLFPCLMLFLTVLAFNLIGDRVARRFDIREAAL